MLYAKSVPAVGWGGSNVAGAVQRGVHIQVTVPHGIRTDAGNILTQVAVRG
jgi:hypothetical protein